MALPQNPDEKLEALPNDPDEWNVEYILSHRRGTHGEIEYLVKWTAGDSSWIPAANFNTNRVLKDYWRSIASGIPEGALPDSTAEHSKAMSAMTLKQRGHCTAFPARWSGACSTLWHFGHAIAVVMASSSSLRGLG